MNLTDNEAGKLLITVGQIDERTKNMEKTLNGNGQPGLKQKVDALESRSDKAEGRYQVAIWLGGGAVGTKIVEWMYYLYHLGDKVK